MFERHNFRGFIVVLSCVFCAISYAKTQPDTFLSASDMVQQADAYRLNETSAKVVSLVSLYIDKQLDKTRLYHVYMREGRQSLVMFKSPAEVGQKMLMLGDNYWLLMPKSRRPIRITAMQKLLGDASVGDISTLTWSGDYQSRIVRKDKVITDDNTSLDTVLLELNASTKGVSYHRIELWLSSQSYFPVKANYYLRSGKLAKVAWFKQGLREGQSAVVMMTLLDKIQPKKQTIIEYRSVTPMKLDEKYYNPAYLSRNHAIDM